MSKKSGKIRGHKFHGDPKRFEVVAHYIGQNFGGKVLKGLFDFSTLLC